MNARFITPEMDDHGRVVYPSCQSDRLSKYANDPADAKPAQCKFSARYNLDGAKLCQRHAAAMALAHLVNESQRDTKQ